MDPEARMAKLVRRSMALAGIMYRSAAPKYANSSDLLSGEGSRRNGARWNPVGVAAVYGSFTPQTALAESLAHANYYRLPIHASMPRIFIAIEFELQLVLNLLDGRNRQALGISEQRLLHCDWRSEVLAGKAPVTQQVGRWAWNSGVEAIVVRSAADRAGQNLVVFVDNLRRGSTLDIVAADRLRFT